MRSPWHDSRHGGVCGSVRVRSSRRRTHSVTNVTVTSRKSLYTLPVHATPTSCSPAPTLRRDAHPIIGGEQNVNTDVQTLASRVEQLERNNADLRTQFRHERRRFRVLGGFAMTAVVGAILVSPANRAALAQGYGTTLQQLLNRVTAVETKTQFVS